MKAAFLYFALVFGTGFVLGPVRLLWAVPRFGIRAAELMEMPIMLVVTIVAARWVIRRLGVPPHRCRAYEDTDLGLEAIRAAGMEAVDVRELLA